MSHSLGYGVWATRATEVYDTHGDHGDAVYEGYGPLGLPHHITSDPIDTSSDH